MIIVLKVCGKRDQYNPDTYDKFHNKLFFSNEHRITVVHLYSMAGDHGRSMHVAFPSSNLRILSTHQTTSNHTMSVVNTHSISTALTVISANIEGLTSANIEGLTASNMSILSEICKTERYHCLCLQ